MENKKRILIFSLAYHPFVGGAEVAIKEITDRTSEVEFDMLTVNLDGKQPSSEKIGNVNIYRIGRGQWSKYLFPWLAYHQACQLHLKNNYQTIWAMMANQAGWAALKFKKKFPAVKYLLTLQEGDSEWDIWWRTILIKPIYKAIYRRADGLQAISRFLAKRAKKIGYQGKIEVVPNGISINQELRIRNQESKNRTIITASRLVKKNGVEYLIRAMKDVDGVLMILGSGKLATKLKGLTGDLGLSDRVKFLGEVANKKVYEYLSQADVFVRASLSEGLGNAFLEAMAMGVPTIGTAVGGIPDFLSDGETGWICEVKDPRSVADKINYVLDENNSETVSQVTFRAKKLVEEKYNWNGVAEKMAVIFNQLSEKI